MINGRVFPGWTVGTASVLISGEACADSILSCSLTSSKKLGQLCKLQAASRCKKTPRMLHLVSRCVMLCFLQYLLGLTSVCVPNVDMATVDDSWRMQVSECTADFAATSSNTERTDNILVFVETITIVSCVRQKWQKGPFPGGDCWFTPNVVGECCTLIIVWVAGFLIAVKLRLTALEKLIQWGSKKCHLEPAVWEQGLLGKYDDMRCFYCNGTR